MNRISELRKEKGVTMSRAALELGIPYTTYIGYEKNMREPNSEMLITLANYFDVSVDYLIGRSNEKSLSLDFDNSDLSQYGITPVKTQRIPLLGDIACGEPIFTDEERESYVEVGTEIKADFCLRAKGNSMINARIYDGDVVFIRQQPMVDNGDIAAVIIDNSATLKRVYYYPEKGKLILNPENPVYEPLVYVGEELNEVRILGKAVAFQSDL